MADGASRRAEGEVPTMRTCSESNPPTHILARFGAPLRSLTLARPPSSTAPSSPYGGTDVVATSSCPDYLLPTSTKSRLPENGVVGQMLVILLKLDLTLGDNSPY